MHTFIAICGILKLRVAKQNEKVDIFKDKWDRGSLDSLPQ